MKDFDYFLDTNIFLRIVAKDDAQKVTACEMLIKAISRGNIKAFTSSLVLAEVVWTSLRSYHISKKEIAMMARGILSIKNLKIQDRVNHFLAMEMYDRHNVKFIDALIASNPSIVKGSTKVVSYDKDFDILGVLRMEPQEVIKKYA